ncbi:MAG: PEP-CTERM sorting domain-containing protein [Pirellulaceae bacterium]
MKKTIAFVAVLCLTASAAVHAQQIGTVVWGEDFESVRPSLQPKVEDPGVDDAALLGWTHSAPANWTIDNSSMPAAGLGVDEWYGWSFATKGFWVDADNQQRDQFLPELGNDNIVAVADPDEYDDVDSAAAGGAYNSILRTPIVDFSSVAGEKIAIAFDSSQRMEPTQILRLTAFYSDGSNEQLLEWSDANGTPDATNEKVFLELNVPAGATAAFFDFAMLEADNDWWWAVDNIQVGSVVPEPGALSMLGLALVGLVSMIRRNK